MHAEHVIRIATGIDSQILGDYEIVGQLERCLSIWLKEAGTVNAYLERLFQCGASREQGDQKQRRASAQELPRFPMRRFNI